MAHGEATPYTNNRKEQSRARVQEAEQRKKGEEKQSRSGKRDGGLEEEQRKERPRGESIPAEWSR